MEVTDKLHITSQMIEDFLVCIKEEGKSESTLRGYRSTLHAFYGALPAEKDVTVEFLEDWENNEKKIRKEAYVYNRMTIIKSFLKYLEDAEAFSQRKKEKKEESTPETRLSREEYRLLLRTAKEMGHRRTYLLIKTVCCLGIRTTEMAYLSLEELTKESVWSPFWKKSRSIKIFEPIQTELLEYAAERGIKEGPVFITKDGQPMQHFLIWKEIKKVCRRLGLSEHKGTPTSLYQLYIDTRKEISKDTTEDADKNYLDFLQEEEKIVGWNIADVHMKADNEANESTILIDTMVKQCVNFFDKLSRDEEDCAIKRLGESLSEILTRKYGHKVTLTYMRREHA